MRASELLRTVDPLPYHDRVRLAAGEGRRLRGTAELTDLLGELGRGDSYQRHLGLQIASAAGDAGYVTRLLRDPDPSVQTRALGAVRRGVDVSDDDLRILYDDAPAALRKRLLRVIRTTGRSSLATRLIDEHRERWGDLAATGLLTSTDSGTVDRLLPELAYCLTLGEWQRLGTRHPRSVLDYAHRVIPDGPDKDEWWRGPAYGVVAALDHDATGVLGLVKAALPADKLPAAIIQVLGRFVDLDPAWTLSVLLSPDRSSVLRYALTPAVRRRLYRYSDEELTALGKLVWPFLTELLSDLPPSRRATVFAAVTASVELGQRVLPDDLLRVLPRAVRVDEAGRMLTLAPVQADLHRSWAVTSFLPYEEAFARLEPEIRRPEAGDRAAVYAAVIGAAGHSREPAHLVDAVTWAARARNDRDPVRVAMLTAVSQVPPSALTDELVPGLDTLLTDALEARDTSWPSRAALKNVAETAVRQGALSNRTTLLDWGLRAHARITEERGRVPLYGIVDGLPRGQEQGVYDVLRPFVEAGAAREEYSLALSIAGAFERRGWTNEHLHSVLEQAVWSAEEMPSRQATEFWLEPPATRNERVGRIIERDVSMARWGVVWSAVTVERTDLLDAVLAEPVRSQRFERNHPLWLVPDYALYRWVPRQRARYAELVTAAARDTRLPDVVRATAVSTLGHVPGIGRAAVEPFLQSDEVLLQEAALAALAWTDSPEQAMPVLLAHAGDDRARVAVYAATRAARFVRPSRLPGLLHPVLAGEGVKVTARKEAARLLGELRAPGASVVLTEAWAGAHRDVRAAITSTAAQYLLHEPASWAVLQQAVHDSDATAIALTQRTPYGMAPKYRSRYADLLIAVTARPEPEVVQAAVQALRQWSRWNPEIASVCAGFVTDLSNRTTVWVDALSVLTGLVAAEPDRGIDELVATVRLLLRLESDPNLPNATPDRDRPARQRLARLIESLAIAFTLKPTEARQVLKQVVTELGDDDQLELRLRLLITSLDWSQLPEELDRVAVAVEGRPLAALEAAQLLSARLTGGPAHWSPELVEPAVAQLVTGERLADGLLAHTFVAAAGHRSGWPGPWRDHLIALRNHPLADVRTRALHLTTAAET
ncbi:hypothetical protein FB561_4139 [Kribbella amoyensis]|uniref:HEAT repeat protein n=1 Tax=Kribbella amoyensis TaxID=996641 RepID=A0A561BVX4_9ACTN|nr:hypothetical protein [Kribbella amoyensis]TWD82988.1 hypothetical protein FB561_4139 [Kribbella amoyensis]